MKTTFKLYEQVQLKKSLPEHNFQIGDVATLVHVEENHEGELGYVLEFFDNNGQTLKVVIVSEEYIALPPKHAVVNCRPYIAA